MHRLESSYRKLSRGIHHRAEANRLIKSFMKTKPYTFRADFDLETGDKVWLVDGTPRQPPIGVSIAIGDAVYNFRSALDHLAWQLVLVNGEQPNEENRAQA